MKIPEGWRLLSPDELVERGDRYCSPYSDIFVAAVNWKLSNRTQGTGTYIRKLNDEERVNNWSIDID